MKDKSRERPPRVCVAVPVFNRIELTTRFLDAFKQSTYWNYTIVVVDDASSDGTWDVITKKYPNVVLLKGDGNLWWAGGTNMAIKYAIAGEYDYVLTINNDAVVGPRYLETMVKCAQQKPSALIGSLITRNDTGKIWSLGGHLDWTSQSLFNLDYYDHDLSIIKNLENPHPAQILNGDGTLIPTFIFKEIGLYNTYFTPQYHADSEIVVRAKRHGYDAYVCLDAQLINEITTEVSMKTLRDVIFNKKSEWHWKAYLLFYVKYAPLKKKWGFFFQYYKFIKDRRGMRTLTHLVKKLWKR